jgi:calpain-7
LPVVPDRDIYSG